MFARPLPIVLLAIARSYYTQRNNSSAIFDRINFYKRLTDISDKFDL
jgi:hypothetical protein